MTETADPRRPFRVILLLGIAVAIIAAISFAFFFSLGDSSETVGGHPLLGKAAPEIDLETLEGERVVLSELRGQPVLVNFWATWCLPCREEFPLMVAAYEKHDDDGLEILGVVHDDTADGARAFVEDMAAEWPMPFDADDVAWNDYVGVGMPTSFFIDADGIVQAFSLGGFTESGLAAQLQQILPEDAEPAAA